MSACLALLALAHLAPAAPPPLLRLEDAVALAQEHHPDVRRADAAVAQVLSRRVGAAMLLQKSPELAVDVGHRHDSSFSFPASTGVEWTVRLGQMVDVAGQRGQRLREIKWAVQVAELQRDEAKLTAAAAAAGDFLRAQAAEASVEVSRARAELAQRVLHMVHDKERAGAIGGLERTLAEVEHGDARAQLQRSMAAQDVALQALWYSLGADPSEPRPLPPLTPPPPGTAHNAAASAALDVPVAAAEGVSASNNNKGTLELASHVDANAAPDKATTHGAAATNQGTGCDGPACPRPLPIAAIVGLDLIIKDQTDEAQRMAQRAVLRRPQGQALLAADAALEASLARVIREVVPSPVFAFEAQKQQPGQQYFGGGITLPLPLWQHSQGPRAELAVQIRRNAIERQVFAALCQKEAQIALRQLAAADAVWQTVHGEQLPAAQAHVDMTVAAWQAGKLDLAQVVLSLRYLTEARQRHTDAIEALWRARIERNRVVGDLP